MDYNKVTPSMEEDFRCWRRDRTPEDLPELERWIAAMIETLTTGKP
jgi:hypothetical protein